MKVTSRRLLGAVAALIVGGGTVGVMLARFSRRPPEAASAAPSHEMSASGNASMPSAAAASSVDAGPAQYANRTPDQDPSSSGDEDADLPQRIGSFDDWLKHYSGGYVDTEDGGPERMRPPKLGVIGDLPELPKGRIAFVRSQRIHLLEVPSLADRVLAREARNTGPVWSRTARESPSLPIGVAAASAFI